VYCVSTTNNTIEESSKYPNVYIGKFYAVLSNIGVSYVHNKYISGPCWKTYQRDAGERKRISNSKEKL